MKNKTKFVVMAKDGWPVKQIEGHPIHNFILRLMWGKHKECADCWHNRVSKKSPGSCFTTTHIAGHANS